MLFYIVVQDIKCTARHFVWFHEVHLCNTSLTVSFLNSFPLSIKMNFDGPILGKIDSMYEWITSSIHTLTSLGQLVNMKSVDQYK